MLFMVKEGCSGIKTLQRKEILQPQAVVYDSDQQLSYAVAWNDPTWVRGRQVGGKTQWLPPFLPLLKPIVCKPDQVAQQAKYGLWSVNC